MMMKLTIIIIDTADDADDNQTQSRRTQPFRCLSCTKIATVFVRGIERVNKIWFLSRVAR